MKQKYQMLDCLSYLKKIGMVLCIVLSYRSSWAQDEVVVQGNKENVSIKNNNIRLDFNLKNGLFSLSNTKGEKIVANAFFRAGGLQSKDACEKRNWSEEQFTDLLGKGKALIVRLSFTAYSDILWKVRLYEDKSYYIFEMGIANDTQAPFQLMSFYPLSSSAVYQGKNNLKNYRILDGNGGGSPTRATDTTDLSSFNNVLVKFGEADHPNILVAGGVTYHEFEKFARVVRINDRNNKSLQLQLYSVDPVGKRIDAGKTYWTNEKFYLCFDNKNPFEALEKYASVLKREQDIKLNYYDFPTECLWGASFFNADSIRPKFNNSKGAVEEMDNAIKSGITKYTKVAMRLVPDSYGENNQQGWWDDEHWAKYSEAMSTQLPHYTAPYLSTESWAKAIIIKGGYPITYMQSGRRSEDFVKLHPDWMLFNDPYRAYTGSQTLRLLQESSYDNPFATGYSRQWWSEKQLWGYDFTDPGFIKHMQQVYANLKKAGIKGIFYDYPENTAWAYEGGFEDKYATTAWAYRNMFKLAKEGLGKDALLQERNIVRGSDIALGLIASQRVWADTDSIAPEMVTYCGLRWYKNRMVINYDMDAKDPSDALPKEHSDGNRSMITMTYVASGRFLLGRSFIQLSKEQIHDLSRTFPYHSTPQSARPVDAFNQGVAIPRVYDFAVNPSWHQLTFYNYNLDPKKKELNKIRVALSKSLNHGGLELNPIKQYYVYDFWNDKFIGLINGSDTLEQTLRPGESRMMSLHEKEDRPQFISTNRHIMQGYLDLKEVRWDAKTKTLSGIAAVIAGDPYIIVIANNGFKPFKSTDKRLGISLQVTDEAKGLCALTINRSTSGDTQWSVKFK